MNITTEKFIKDAFESLYMGGQDEAKAAAEHLIKENNINGYNLLSECFLIDGDVTKAASVIDVALKSFPNHWQLWFKKANIETTMNSFDSAHASYKKTLEFEGVDAELISLNIAVLMCKEDKLDEALKFVDGCRVVDYQNEFMSVRYRILFLQEKYSQMIEEFNDYEESLPDSSEAIFEMSDVYFYLGQAYYNLGINDKAKTLLKKAIRTDFRNTEAMELYRELNGEMTVNEKLFIFQVERGRMLVITTLADTEEEAIGFIKEIFGDDIQIAEATTINNQNNIELKGLIEIAI
ncbi:MAG: tetratricopeptide repeat protein [Candidatus Kapaibacterium sp.]